MGVHLVSAATLACGHLLGLAAQYRLAGADLPHTPIQERRIPSSGGCHAPYALLRATGNRYTFSRRAGCQAKGSVMGPPGGCRHWRVPPPMAVWTLALRGWVELGLVDGAGGEEVFRVGEAEGGEDLTGVRAGGGDPARGERGDRGAGRAVAEARRRGGLEDAVYG